MGGFASRAIFKVVSIELGCPHLGQLGVQLVEHTLLESIFQLIRPDWLSIFTGVSSRTSPIFQVLLGLEIASSPSRRHVVGPDRVQPTQLLRMKPSLHSLVVYAGS
jgi:hypothetical protein